MLKGERSRSVCGLTEAGQEGSLSLELQELVFVVRRVICGLKSGCGIGTRSMIKRREITSGVWD